MLAEAKARTNAVASKCLGLRGMYVIVIAGTAHLLILIWAQQISTLNWNEPGATPIRVSTLTKNTNKINITKKSNYTNNADNSKNTKNTNNTKNINNTNSTNNTNKAKPIEAKGKQIKAEQS